MKNGFRRHARHRALFEREVDERIFQSHGFLAAINDVVLDCGGQAIAFGAEGVEQLGDAFAMEAFVAHRPAHNLPHALHLVEAREVHQHREGSEQLQPFGKAAEHGERARDVLVRIDAEGREIIMLVLHFLILKEHTIFAFGHPDGVKEVRIGRDMHGFHVGKGREHHLDFGGLEHAAIFFMVAILHLDIGLREKAEDLREQIALMIGELLRPVAAIFAQGHFFGHPVDLLLALPEIIGPRIFERLIGFAGFGERHGLYLPVNERVPVEATGAEKEMALRAVQRL